jgi:DNA-directed RNA polymerase specialized sigma24 family protein
MKLENLPYVDTTELTGMKKAEIIELFDSTQQEWMKFFFALKKDYESKLEELRDNPAVAAAALVEAEQRREQMTPVKMGRPGLSEDVKESFRKLRNDGLSVREIARKTGVSVGAVSKHLRSQSDNTK